jgi:hypothetical protein
MTNLDSRNPHARTNTVDLNSRNPHAVGVKADPRNYTTPYVYQEFPKYVKLADGSGIIVNNADEESAACGSDAAEVEAADADPLIGNHGNSAPADPPKKGRPTKAEQEARAAQAQALLGG